MSRIEKPDLNQTILYDYGATGNRIRKRVTTNGATESTWYVRDAQGNVMAIYNGTTPAITESHIYGSSRLGMYNWSTSGREYELTSYLGNVLATISDTKVPVSSYGVNIDYYEAGVLTAQDYYAFGGLMNGRKGSTVSRYGFNGKENDNEVKGEGNQQDYGLRIYDNRLAKFLSIDPLTRNFAWNSPYAFAENSPVKFIDLDGAEKFDPASKPTGITYIQVATVPISPQDANSDYSINAGKYHLFPVSDPSGKRSAYWLARYTYTDGPYAGMHKDDWIVGTDGVSDFVNHSDKYYNKAAWNEFMGGPGEEFSLKSIGKGYKKVVSNPANWVGGAGIWAAGAGAVKRNALEVNVGEMAKGRFSSFSNLADLKGLFKGKNLSNATDDLLNSGWTKVEGEWGSKTIFQKQIGRDRYYATWEPNNINHSNNNLPTSYWKLTKGKISAYGDNVRRVSDASNFTQ